MTNNHQNEIEDVVNDAGFQLKSMVKNHGGSIVFFDEAADTADIFPAVPLMNFFERVA